MHLQYYLPVITLRISLSRVLYINEGFSLFLSYKRVLLMQQRKACILCIKSQDEEVYSLVVRFDHHLCAEDRSCVCKEHQGELVDFQNISTRSPSLSAHRRRVINKALEVIPPRVRFDDSSHWPRRLREELASGEVSIPISAINTPALSKAIA